MDYHRGVPSLLNDDAVLDPTVAAVRKQFGDVVEEGQPSLGGEDFALLAGPGAGLPACASAPARRGATDKLHNSDYQPDERCIGLGVQALSRAALELLARLILVQARREAHLRLTAPARSAAIWRVFWRAAARRSRVVARGAHLAAIRADGLRVETPDEALTVRVAASDDPARLGPQDAVLVTVKAPALPEVAARIAPLLGPQTAGRVRDERHPLVVFPRARRPRWTGARLPLPRSGRARWRGRSAAQRAIGGVFWPACSVPRPAWCGC